ncbi:hypothetical protein LSH36_27g09046 [Paralvinella palmiformis]|uniref:Nucleoside diphosphate kinase-like domain-containing protein n=1 Tax=Paralvinella palmiformis TaxID=53620 RepID=A0AAD9NEP2_9ANNE|nr:hypothetical protein LSH36_27g09046 [Paralvinella palmiformis]
MGVRYESYCVSSANSTISDATEVSILMDMSDLPPDLNEASVCDPTPIDMPFTTPHEVQYKISAGSILQDLIQQYLPDNEPCPTFKLADYIARNANNHHQKLRPKDPVDLDFVLNDEHVPDNFLRKDVTVNSGRHMIFASDTQLPLLAKAKMCSMARTFNKFQLTLALIKPDAALNPIAMKGIEKIILHNKFQIIRSKNLTLSRSSAENFYAEHEEVHPLPYG